LRRRTIKERRKEIKIFGDGGSFMCGGGFFRDGEICGFGVGIFFFLLMGFLYAEQNN
jgi:hypothetical protein